MAGDDQQFELAMHHALKLMVKEVRAASLKRQDYVMAKLEEEMAKLRPHKHRLLHGNVGNCHTR